MSVKYLSGGEKVLEIGGNIGRNSLVIAKLLKNSSNLVTLESDINISKKLIENRDLNKLNFHVEASALSNRQLIQKGWDTIPSNVLKPGYKRVNTIKLEELKNKYNIVFDTLVLDCEGAFYYILNDMPEILNNINKILMENDYRDIDHYNYISKTLREKGFYLDYSEGGGWGPCRDNFFEVWLKKISIAYVTGYIGQAPTNIPKITKDVDSYFITNNKEIADNLIKNNVFTKVITINNIPVINSRESVYNYIKNSMSSKILKVFPQTFLEKQYDFVVWYDNKFSVNVKDTIRAINSWDNSHSLMLHNHPFLNNVKQELRESMKQPRYVYEKEKYIKYINECKKEGMSDEHKFHSQTGYIIYNLKHSMTNKIQEEWMYNIKKCGIQCQISFNLFRQNYEEYIGEYKYSIGR